MHYTCMKTTYPLLVSAAVAASLGTLLAEDSTKQNANERRDGYTTQSHSTATPMFARGTEIVGLEVRNNQDEKLGKVQDLVIDVTSSRVVGLVVSTGGVLGVGGSQATVPMASFRYDAGRKVLLTDLNAATLKDAPAFASSGWQASSQPAEVAQLYRYYRLPADSSWESRTSVGSYEHKGSPSDRDSERTSNRGSDELTPLDQGNSESDRERTAEIRKAVMAHTTLSFTGKNVKIITAQGRVTLRGSVPSENEREQIVKLAESVAPGQVTDQIQVDAASKPTQQ